MLKILSSTQTKQLDQFTIEHEPITSIDLMERACHAFVDWMTPRFVATKKIGVVCGTGNNGGDGLGIARLLSDWGYPIQVWIVKSTVKDTDDFKQNLNRLTPKINLTLVSTPDQLDFSNVDILIDALFGSGLSRKAEGLYAEAIKVINQSQATKIAVDIPSGLFADQHSDGDIVYADFTVSFQLPKLAFFFPENEKYVGSWQLVDIGLSKHFLKTVQTNYLYLTPKAVKKLLHPRSKFSHKGNFGHALIISGSKGTMGAAVLSARAALRSGLGLLTLHVPEIGLSVLQTSVPEAMVSIDQNENHFSTISDNLKYDSVGIGPGLGQHKDSVKAFESLLTNYQRPMVFDADALNMISKNGELMQLIPKGSILTPHPKEFERLVGSWKNDFERLEKQKNLSAQLKSVVVLKGANTSIASAEGTIYFNSTGNPGMATGGSGDVLTGILVGLLAQGYESIEAALLGVYLHGLAGDLAVRELGMESLIASDLVDYLPQAFKSLKS